MGRVAGHKLPRLTWWDALELPIHGMNNHAMTQRPRRQSRIIELIRSGSVTSQDQLRELLESNGLQVTQATLSRDLRALGVVKGGEGYLLPDSNGGGSAREAGDELAQVLGMYAFSVCEAGAMVVVRTGAGHAQIVAVGLDRSGLEEAVGTLAGDDTIFIATRSVEAAGRVAQTLRELAGIES